MHEREASTEQVEQAQPDEAQQGRHKRRPPLAEVDTWELWQAWQRGERATVRPWLGLLASFCLVLAAMYSFFFFSITLTDDTIAAVIMTIVFLVLLISIGRRVSPGHNLGWLVTVFMGLVSGGAFAVWLLLAYLSGWNPLVAIAATVGLGLAGAFLAVPSLNRIEQQAASGPAD